jgi:hypothetical protein
MANKKGKKLGYMWYTNDWGSSDKVFELNLAQRGLYRELIDLAYKNDNKTPLNVDLWTRRFNTTIQELNEVLESLVKAQIITIKNGVIFIPSVENRMIFIRSGRKGGRAAKGGENEAESKGIDKGMGKGIDKGMEKGNGKGTPKGKGKQITITKEITIENENKKGARIFGIETIKDEFEKAGYWRENFCGQENIPTEVLTREFDLFLVQIGLTGEYNEVGYNWQKHFYHWRKTKKGKNGAKEVGGVAAGFVVGDVQDFRQAK